MYSKMKPPEELSKLEELSNFPTGNCPLGNISNEI